MTKRPSRRPIMWSISARGPACMAGRSSPPASPRRRPPIQISKTHLSTPFSTLPLRAALPIYEEAIQAADHVVDIGPGAGVHGGEIVAAGKPAEVAANPRSLTGQYLSGKLAIELPRRRQAPD